MWIVRLNIASRPWSCCGSRTLWREAGWLSHLLSTKSVSQVVRQLSYLFTALEHGQQNQQKLLLLTLAFCGRIVLSYLQSHLLSHNLFQAFSHSISGFCCPKLVSTCHIHKSLKCLFPSTLAFVLGRPRNKEEKRAHKFFVSFENQRKTENRSAVDL